jgi:hypothetical protein
MTALTSSRTRSKPDLGMRREQRVASQIAVGISRKAEPVICPMRDCGMATDLEREQPCD